MKTPFSHPARRQLYCLALFCALALRLPAQTVPALVNYQGRLANPDGSALTTADYQLTFKVYDAATNGTLVWGPQIFDSVAALGHGARIPVVQGYFNVMLGPVDTNGATLANAFTGTNRFVEVTVSNRPPIAPRQQILTAPFAFRAASAATVDDGAISLQKLAARQVGTNVGVGGLAVSLSTGSNVDIASASDTAILNLTVTLVTTGRPVMVLCVPDEAASSYGDFHMDGGTATQEMSISLYRGATKISSQRLGYVSGASANVFWPASSVQFVDATAPAGTNTYLIKGAMINSSPGHCQFVKIMAFEF